MQEFRLGNEYTNVPPVLQNSPPNTADCPGVGPAVDQLDVSAFKIQLFDQNAHLCKKWGVGGKPRKN